MVFSSETFLFLFLPIFLAAYYLTPPKWPGPDAAHRVLPVLRLVALRLPDAAGAPTRCGPTCSGSSSSKYPGHAPRPSCSSPSASPGTCSVLGVFKYLNFFVDSFAALWGTTPDALGIHWRLLLPIGISFYVFHSISYLVDVYRGDAKVSTQHHRLRRLPRAVPAARGRPDPALQGSGAAVRPPRALLGAVQRRLAALPDRPLDEGADRRPGVAPLADAMFSACRNPTHRRVLAGRHRLLRCSSISTSPATRHMAIGLALMIGFRFAENFNMPYISRTDHRVLAALAYLAEHLAAHLPLHLRWAATVRAWSAPT